MLHTLYTQKVISSCPITLPKHLERTCSSMILFTIPIQDHPRLTVEEVVEAIVLHEEVVLVEAAVPP